MGLTLVFIIISMFFAFYDFLQRKILGHRRNLPPCPLKLPIIGHFHLLKSPLHHTFQKISQKYGKIFSLQLGNRLVVVISSPDTVEECFTKNDIILANRFPFVFGKYLSYNHTVMSVLPYGDLWRNLRRITTLEVFSNKCLNKFSIDRKDEVRTLLNKLSRNSLFGFAKVELKSLFTDLTYNVVMRTITGKRYEEKTNVFRKIIREIISYSGVTNPLDYFPVLAWIGYGGIEKRLETLGKMVDDFLQDLVDEQRCNRGSSTNTLLDRLLSLQESEPEYYNDKIIKATILILLIAGTETTTSTLEWALSNLLNNPNSLNRIRDELDIQVGQERLIDEHDIPKLQYLQCAIEETLRLNPAAPLLTPHMASQDCTIGGFNIPSGTILLVNAWAMQRDHELWEDSISFKPERFEVESEKLFAHKFVPFGEGRRACPGATMAQRLISLTLGSLIQCYEWKRASEKEIDHGIIDKGALLHKVKPLEATCRARPILKKVLSDTA